MPIKGIEEIRRLPRVGVIRLGEKRKNASGKEYPAKLDYFNLKDAPGVAEVFGEKPREIEIMLPHENRDVFFPQARKAYGTSGLFCAGDGEKASRVRLGASDGEGTKVAKGQLIDPEGESFVAKNHPDTKIGQRFEMPCLGENCPYTQKKFCRPIGQFLFLIPRVPTFGCYQISTTSFNSMVELNSYIEAIRAAAGRISMIPLTLALVPKKTNIPGTRTSTTIFHLKLEYRRPLSELVRYRDVKYIAADLLPEIGHETPEDLYPHGGAALEEEIGGALPPEEGDAQEPEEMIPVPLPSKEQPVAPPPAQVAKKAPRTTLFK